MTVPECEGGFYGPGLEMAVETFTHIPLHSLSSWPQLDTGALGNVVQHTPRVKADGFAKTSQSLSLPPHPPAKKLTGNSSSRSP